MQGDATIEPGATVARARADRRRAPTCSPARAVRGSVLGAGVIVEQGAVLETAVLHDEARVSHDCTVDHSVVGRNTVVKPDVDAHRPHDRRRRRDGPVGDADLGGSLPIGARVASPDHDRPDTMKAMVTGGAGFIGSTLVDRLLAEGWRVDVGRRPLDRLARQPRRTRARSPIGGSRSTASTCRRPRSSTSIAHRRPR